MVNILYLVMFYVGITQIEPIGYNPKKPREELQVIENPDKIEYPTELINFIQVSNTKLEKAQEYAKKRGGECLGKTGRIN